MLIPIVAAFIGWLSALLIIALFFYPRRPIEIGPFTFQGIVPKYTTRIAKELAASLAAQFSIEEWLQEQLESPSLQQDFEILIDKRLDGLVDALREQMPLVEMFLTQKLAGKLKHHASVELMKMVPQIPQSIGGRFSLNDAISSIGEKNPNLLQNIELNPQLTSAVKHDLFKLSLFGALAGFLIGLLITLGTLI